MATGTCITDANAAFFDAAHQFAGCIPGIHEVLRRQGLLAGRWCLDPHEELSPGQMSEIDRAWSTPTLARQSSSIWPVLARQLSTEHWNRELIAEN